MHDKEPLSSSANFDMMKMKGVSLGGWELWGCHLNYFVLNRGDDASRSLTETFNRLAKNHGLLWNDHSPDVVVSIGGDGTMLHAFHQFRNQLDRIAFVGIHTGHLGFYADWKPNEVERLISLMANGGDLKDRVVKYPLLRVELTTEQGTHPLLALNEFTLKGAEATLVANLHINDSSFELFRGDGICISTPSGSTAYNKSLNGAVLHPALDAIQITEIASINNRIFRTIGSSLILPKHHHCDIIPRAGQKLLLTLDHITVPYSFVLNVRSTVAEQKVTFARYRPFPFWDRVKEAFIGDSIE